MGELTYRGRQQLADSEFAIPEKRAYPIHDKAHARNALARVHQYGTPSEQKEVCGAVADRYPDIHAGSCPMHSKPKMPSHIKRKERLP